MANVKNYRKQGGEEWVIGGKQTVESGGELDAKSGAKLKFADEEVLAQNFGAGIALVGAMTGGYAEAEHSGDATTEVLGSDDGGDRNVLIIIKVIAEFTGTTKPKFQIGETDTVDKFFEMGDGEDPPAPDAGEIYVAAGVLTNDKALIITKADASGGTEGGAIQVFAIALPDEA